MLYFCVRVWGLVFYHYICTNMRMCAVAAAECAACLRVCLLPIFYLFE